MAAANPVQSLQEEAMCSICLEYYKDPVITECGHNFCRACITECWEGAGTACPCPQCRQICPQRSIRPNRQLLNMVELVKQLSLQAGRPQQENLTRFCKEDQKPICQVSQDHKTHAVHPIKEAVKEYKKRKHVTTVRTWNCVSDKGGFQDYKDVTSSLKRCENVMLKNPEVIKKNYTVLVTLDADTASPRMILSQAGRRVRGTFIEQPRPDNPKRFTDYFFPCVLGREGFTSGRHYWEMQLLQEGDGWAVGIAKESVPRKGGLTESPEGGVWAVGQGYNGQYWALTFPRSPLSLCEDPSKLGLYLDYEGGQLSLYNADTREELYAFTSATFADRVFPYFRLLGTELRLV